MDARDQTIVGGPGPGDRRRLVAIEANGKVVGWLGLQLLNVLIAYPERVFSRSELVDKVQEYRFDGYDRTIDSHVKNLRKKIAAHLPGKEGIQTIYGVGCRLSIC